MSHQTSFRFKLLSVLALVVALFVQVAQPAQAAKLTASTLVPSDIAILGYITNGSPDSFSFVNFTALDAGAVIYFTDNGWTGSGFRGSTSTDGDGNENLIRFTANATIPAGTIIRSTDTSADYTWTTSGAIGTTTSGSYNNLSMSQSGEQIAAFQSTNLDNPLYSGYTAIFQIDNTGTFEDATSSTTGNVIPGLSQGSDTAVLFDNTATYAAFNTGSLASGTAAEWLDAINNPANWTFGTGTSLPTGTIVVNSGTTDPTITTHPASQTIPSGTSATLNVVATGTEPLSYQWYQGDSGDTTTPVGSNADTYTTPSLTTNTNYWVRVSNSVGNADSNTAVITVSGALTPIYDIQGTGSATPLSGTVVTIQGVVVGDYEYAGVSGGTLNGFYVQEVTGDGNPATSDAIFVYTGTSASAANLGDLVRVTGTATEYQSQTQLGSVSNVTVLGSGNTLAPTDITLPFASESQKEQYEGMLVRVNQTLYVTEHYQLGRFGQVTLSSGERLYQPTHLALPGSAERNAIVAANALNQIILDDTSQLQNPDPILFGRNGNPLSASNTLRGGDTITGLTGIFTYTGSGNGASGNAYRIRPVTPTAAAPAFVAANARPVVPTSVAGEIKVASMNLLNYFNTFGAGNCTGGVGGAALNCRGAENSTEFERQYVKTVNAILGTGADVIGVMEMENDGYGSESAIQHLVNELNAASSPGTYAFIDADALTGQTNALGTDAIKVGLLYKPGTVTPVGTTAVLNTVDFVNGGDSVERNRPSLLQAFRHNASNEIFLVDVNHLKSKGSACDGEESGFVDDGQGYCATVRTNAANALLAWFASNPTGTSDSDLLVLGDMNSYAKEYPIAALEAGGLTNFNLHFGSTTAYSYVYSGQWGYLDYALGSASMLAQTDEVVEWHINADEPGVLDYNTNYKSAGQVISLYSQEPYRASDHDPIIVGLTLDDSISPSVASITRAGPNPTNAASVDFTVTFSEPVTGVDETDFTPAGTVSGAAVTGISGSDAVYTLTVNTGTGSGTLALDLNASGTGIADLETNPIAGGFTGGEEYTLARGPIPDPWGGGISIESDQNIVAVARPHVGSQVASYIAPGAGSTEQYVPMLFKDAFGGAYDAALYIQNQGDVSANLSIEFRRDDGTVAYTLTEPLAAKASKGYWLPSIPALGASFVGGAKVTSDQPVLAVGRPHISGEVMTYNGVAAGSLTAWLPMFFKDGYGSYNAALYVQNLTGNEATLTIEYLNLDGTVACTDTDTLAANASKGYWSKQVICDTGSLPAGFVGGVKVTSNQAILTVGRPHLGTQITTYNGFAGGATTAYVPMLFRKAFGGSYNAALYLQNVSGSSADVTIDYVDNAGAVAATQNVTLAAGAITNAWLPSVAGLPDGFVGGARITATGGDVIAVGRPHLGSEITAYNGATAGSLNAYLPMLFKNAFGGGYDSAFYIQNVTANAATVNIKFYDDAGTLSCIKTVNLAANATTGFWMPSTTCAP